MARQIYVDGFELMQLNREFVSLIRKHEDDTDVEGESREHFLGFGDAEDDTEMIKYHASICNAWDELCSLHDGLRESSLGWYAGAHWTEYPDNEFDVYVGIGNELDRNFSND